VRTSFCGKDDDTMPGSRYDASTKAKAIRLVREHAGDYPTRWAAITAVSGRLGVSAETLRKWIRQAPVLSCGGCGTRGGADVRISYGP
jgi:transposase